MNITDEYKRPVIDHCANHWVLIDVGELSPLVELSLAASAEVDSDPYAWRYYCPRHGTYFNVGTCCPGN